MEFGVWSLESMSNVDSVYIGRLSYIHKVYFCVECVVCVWVCVCVCVCVVKAFELNCGTGGRCKVK